MNCVNQQVGSKISSFFPGQKDEIPTAKHPEYLRMQRNGVVVQPLNFPATKSVLWNRTAQSDPEVLHLTTKRNIRLHINEKTLRLAHRHVNQAESPLLCFLVGSISVDSQEDSIDITVDRFDPGREVVSNNHGSKKVKRKVPTTVVPGDHVVPLTLIQGLSGADTSVTHTKEEFQRAFQVLFGRISSQEPINISHFVSLKVSCHSHAGDKEIILNINCNTISMATTIQATSVAAVPIIPTALARNLSGPLRLSEVQGVPKNGYLTMDNTRKLLLLLESDPKAFSLPLLGIWVSGIYSIHHPYIWACCLRFIHCTAIQQRLLAPPNAFLLLQYSPVKSTPEFWECRQDQGDSELKMFELYSCYENLHLEIPPGPSSSDPLCFELISSSGGISRSLFEQAAEIWQDDQKQPRVNQDGLGQSSKEETTSGQVHGEDDPNLVPRPSPFPHPQKLQFVFPDKEETSLSLSFDELISAECSPDAFANQQVLQKAHLTIKELQSPPQEHLSQRIQHDQENNQFMLQREISQGFPKRMVKVKQHTNYSVMQNLPSREPLKQILAPNQTQTKGNSNQHIKISRKPCALKSVGDKKLAKPTSKPEKRNGHRASSLNFGVDPSLKNSDKVHETGLGRQQMRQNLPEKKKGGNEHLQSNAVGRRPLGNFQGGENRPRQQDSVKETISFPLPTNQAQRPVLETVFEVTTPDGTLNKTMDETEIERHITGMSEMSQSPLSLPHFQVAVGDAYEETCTKNTDGCQRSNDCRERSTMLVTSGEDFNKEKSGNVEECTSKKIADSVAENQLCDSLGTSLQHEEQKKSRQSQQSKGMDKSTVDKSHEGSLQEEQVVFVETGQSSEKDKAKDITTPDPYALLLRQEAQLRLLQEQIKLLLQQQPTPLPNPNALLTPPRTPQFDSSCPNENRKLPNHSPVSMVTACTNTGESLLLGTPIKPNGKKSAATSPIKEQEMSHKERSEELNQHNSKESQRHDSSINPEELSNQLLNLDDPSQTLASSLHAVDIPSFYESPSNRTSPNPTHQASREGMETSFTSPVLGESASILMDQRQTENKQIAPVADKESMGEKSNHVSLLQRNERQFYDNLLNQVKQILDHQDQDESHPLEHKNERTAQSNQSTEPTREEVVMATIKELDKIKHSTLGTGNMEYSKSPVSGRHWPLHRSLSLSAIPDHPRINYMSFSVDETLDEVLSEADLHQLHELQPISTHSNKNTRDRAATFSVFQEDKSILSRKGSVEKDHLCDSRSLTSVDYTWNNLSMATKDYLGKYCLAPRELVKSGDCRVDKQLPEAKNGQKGPKTSFASQGCSVPPSTPEPAKKNDGDSQILDITRLKKLPKLF